ncbi:MAG TPA: cellulose biosynthesis protein BcsS, partial [Afifellaceae bacterium]|nr:cellulose biosynthesis protein BcsS [Afifellaceae bacterium]
ASGSLSSVHTSYYVTTRAMRRLNKRFAIGPEAVAMGSRFYDQIRLGLAGEAWLGKTMLVISAGHGWDNANGLMAEGEGVYGNVHFNIGF